MSNWQIFRRRNRSTEHQATESDVSAHCRSSTIDRDDSASLVTAGSKTVENSPPPPPYPGSTTEKTHISQNVEKSGDPEDDISSPNDATPLMEVSSEHQNAKARKLRDRALMSFRKPPNGRDTSAKGHDVTAVEDLRCFAAIDEVCKELVAELGTALAETLQKFLTSSDDWKRLSSAKSGSSAEYTAAYCRLARIACENASAKQKTASSAEHTHRMIHSVYDKLANTAATKNTTHVTTGSKGNNISKTAAHPQILAGDDTELRLDSARTKAIAETNRQRDLVVKARDKATQGNLVEPTVNTKKILVQAAGHRLQASATKSLEEALKGRANAVFANISSEITVEQLVSEYDGVPDFETALRAVLQRTGERLRSNSYWSSSDASEYSGYLGVYGRVADVAQFYVSGERNMNRESFRFALKVIEVHYKNLAEACRSRK